MKTTRVALAQINVTVGSLAENGNKILSFVETAKQADCDIVVFPELAITGYPPEDLVLKKHFVEDNLKILNSLAKDIKGIVGIVGFIDCDKQGNLYNAAAIIANKKIVQIYRKNCLVNYGVFDEKRYFSEGMENMIFEIDGVSFGVSICEDIWEEKGPCSDQAKAGAQVLLNLSASPYQCEKVYQRESVLSKRARKLNVSICYCNLVGGQDELVFDGASIILDSRGRRVACGKQFKEDLVIADVSFCKKVKSKRVKNIKKVQIAKTFISSEKLYIRHKQEKRFDKNKEIYQALVLGTKDYILKNGFKRIVLGISGGIDSALVAAIACDAIGKENVLGVSMPSQYTSKATRSDAKRLAKNLGINFKEISIKNIFKLYTETMKPCFKNTKVNLAEENLQARIRGNILMALSNKFGHLVLTTGNKSEIAVGYCTLYGDMAGGFAAIKDIPKTEVYDLVKYRNKKEKKACIPKSILNRAPTAELKKNQKDQDTLPPYNVLDPILEAYVEGDQSLRDVKSKKYNKKLINKIVTMVDCMEYKRRQAPLGVKITPKAFGGDKRFPVTNKYQK